MFSSPPLNFWNELRAMQSCELLSPSSVDIVSRLRCIVLKFEFMQDMQAGVPIILFVIKGHYASRMVSVWNKQKFIKRCISIIQYDVIHVKYNENAIKLHFKKHVHPYFVLEQTNIFLLVICWLYYIYFSFRPNGKKMYIYHELEIDSALRLRFVIRDP